MSILESVVVLVVQVGYFVLCTTRNLVLLTLSIDESSMVSGRKSAQFLLKSITTSFVFPTLRDRLFVQLHHFLSVEHFIFVADKAYYSCAICKLDDVCRDEHGLAVVRVFIYTGT